MEQILAAWNRFTVKLLMVIRVLTLRRKTMLLLGKEVYKRLFAEAKELATNQPEVSRVINGELVGAPLSLGTGAQTRDPAMCDHPLESMKRRSNGKNLWWTCASCQSRWDRKPIEDALVGEEPQHSEVLLFGKHLGKAMGWVYENDRQYCQWIQMTAEQEVSPGKPLLRMAAYISNREYEEANPMEVEDRGRRARPVEEMTISDDEFQLLPPSFRRPE